MGILRRRHNRRKRPLGRRLLRAAGLGATGLRQLLRLTLTLGLVAAVPVGIYVGYRALLSAEYFAVTDIRLNGAERLDRDDVLAIAGLDGRHNIFTLSEEGAERRLLANPWIIYADVEHELPRTVHIEIEERQPGGFVFWGDLYLVDTGGIAIEIVEAAHVQGPLITGVEPVFDGDASALAGERADRITGAIALAALYDERSLSRWDTLAEVHVDELIGFTLLTSRNGIEIRLGSDRFGERLDRLRDVISALSDADMRGRYVLLDNEGSLTRVAVGPARPGRDRAEGVNGL